MTDTPKPDLRLNVIQTNLDYLKQLVDDASVQILKAQIAISAGSRNEAIGWLIDIPQLMTDAQAHLQVIFITHRKQ